MGNLLSHVVRILLWLMLVVFLSSCLSESKDAPALQNVPIVALSFPSASVLLSTDGDSFDLSGLVIANASDAIVTELDFDLLSFSLTDPDEVPAPVLIATQLNDESKPFFNWKQQISDLQVGNNTVAVTASFGNITNGLLASQSITRGTGYEWKSAIQLDPTDSDKAYILDTVQKTLVFVDVSDEEETDSNIDGMLQGDKLSVTMDSSMLVEPVDFAFISDTELIIVDASQATVFKLELTINRMSMSNVIESVTGDLSTLSSPTDPDAVAVFNYPVAITTDRSPTMAATYAYVADQDPGRIIRVDVATGDRVILTSDSIPNNNEPLIEMPNDLVFHQYIDESLATINELLVINAYREIIAVDIPADILDGGMRTLLDSPLEMLANPEIVEDVNFQIIKNLALADDGNKLYVSDGDFFGIIEVDLRSTNEDILDANGVVLEGSVPLRGRRDLLSGVSLSGEVPNEGNLFLNPGSSVFDGADNRLLVLDNERGSIIAVNLVEPTDVNVDPPIGARTFLAGGLTQEDGPDDDSSLDVSPLAPPGFLTKLITPADLIFNGSSFNSLLTLDKAANGAIAVSLSGSNDRTFIGQVASLNEDDEFDEVETEKRRFIDPRKIQYSSSSNRFYVIDAAADKVFSSLGARTIRSEADSVNPLTDPRGLVVFDSDLEDEDEQLIIITADEMNDAQLVSITIDNDSESNDSRLPLTLACSITDPVAMVLHKVESDMSESQLVIADRSGSLYLSNLDGTVCTDLGDTSAGSEIVDMELDLRNIENENLIKLILLDKANKNVSSVEVTIDTATATSAAVLSDGSMGNNVFINPNSMVFNSQTEILYVLDSTIRSLYMVDLASRDVADGSTDRTGMTGVVSGQRFVISRGAPMACDISPDCDH